MASVYVREKVNGVWKQKRVLRERRSGDLTGPFYARPFVNGRQQWKTLTAKTFTEAKAEAEQIAATPSLSEEVAGAPGRTPLQVAVDRFMASIERTRERSTLKEYAQQLKQFVASTNIRFIEEATTETVIRYRDYMQSRKLSAGTQHNRCITILSLLKANGIKTKFSVGRDLPRTEEEPAVPFTDDELKKLFASSTPEENARFRFFLGVGARDQEVVYASWADIDFERGVFHIRRKEDVGFSVKNHQSRSVPMPTSLVALLKERRKTAPHSRWIFVNESGEPDRGMLRKLKKAALRAKINCNHCEVTLTVGKYNNRRKAVVSCSTHPVCEHIYLHRLRKTCATRWHRAGIPIQDLKTLLGHKSLETTQRYLGITPPEQLRGLIDLAARD
jgi:integrase